MMRMSKGIFTTMSVSVYFLAATGLPAASRPRHARPTWHHKVELAKERAPTPNSASGERRKGPSPILDMAGDRKSMEIPIRCSNKTVLERTYVLLLYGLRYMVGGVMYVLLL